MRQTLLALILIPALAYTTLFGGRLLPAHTLPSASAHPMVPCSGIPTPC